MMPRSTSGCVVVTHTASITVTLTPVPCFSRLGWRQQEAVQTYAFLWTSFNWSDTKRIIYIKLRQLTYVCSRTLHIKLFFIVYSRKRRACDSFQTLLHLRQMTYICSRSVHITLRWPLYVLVLSILHSSLLFTVCSCERPPIHSQTLLHLHQMIYKYYMFSFTNDDVGLHVLGCRVDILGTNCTKILKVKMSGGWGGGGWESRFGFSTCNHVRGAARRLLLDKKIHFVVWSAFYCG